MINRISIIFFLLCTCCSTAVPKTTYYDLSDQVSAFLDQREFTEARATIQGRGSMCKGYNSNGFCYAGEVNDAESRLGALIDRAQNCDKVIEQIETQKRLSISPIQKGSEHHILLDGHIRLKLSATHVEILVDLESVALHKRDFSKQMLRHVIPEHLLDNMAAYREPESQKLLSQARFISEALRDVIEELFAKDRRQLAELLCLSGYDSVMNIETGFRKPNKLAIRVLRYLESLPNTKAQNLIEELKRHEPK